MTKGLSASVRTPSRLVPTLATVILILCVLLGLTTSIWGGLLHFSQPTVKAASPLIRRVNIPYFNTAPVPLDQTAIFWFGQVNSTSDYTDVRMGYNKTEVYVSLQIFDRHLWYDTNKQAPKLANGDNATIYLDTIANATKLDHHAYEFQAGVSGHVQSSKYQAAYSGNGSAWTPANIRFTAVYGWRGSGFNGAGEDKGWTMTYHLPFSSLGLSGPPTQGALWKLAVRVHNRDDLANKLADKWWPDSPSDTHPASWGDLVFGLSTYQPPKTSHQASYMIRNKLNGQTVTDGMVGGSLGCGTNVHDVWTQLGNKSYPGVTQVNIQNESDVSDWPCFSKFYVTFPLSSLPRGKGVATAKVTLYLWSNSNTRGLANPSYVQVAVVNQDWNPKTLSWNDAPLVGENFGSTIVHIRSGKLHWPGVPYTWDVSKALADAYATGQPLRLVFYSTDDNNNSGKYFSSSTVPDWNAQARPTLQVTLGTTASLAASAPTSASIAATAPNTALLSASLFLPTDGEYSSWNRKVG